MLVFFFPSLPSQPCICKLPLCLLHSICAWRFHPPLRLTVAHDAGLSSFFLFFLFFSISPPPAFPPSARSVPLNFLGTLSRPFQIGLGLNFPCFMSLCCRIPHLIWTHHKNCRIGQTWFCQNFFPPSGYLSFFFFFWVDLFSPSRRFDSVLRDRRRGIGQMEVSIKKGKKNKQKTPLLSDWRWGK